MNAVQTIWNDKRYHSLDYELKHIFGKKLYKLSLNAGFSCPNRDGTLDTRGCIFCSAGGSGDFAGSSVLSITQQIDEGINKAVASGKPADAEYIAYFQAFTNTWAPVKQLRQCYMEAVRHPSVRTISIATRPDCLDSEICALLKEINDIKPVWIELGLQTMHETTACYIRRGYPLSCFEAALQQLNQLGIPVITHVILGLPYETAEDMTATAVYLSGLPIQGIKLQLLHVLKGTDLADEYLRHTFETLCEEEYIDILIRFIELLPPSVTIHRITGDGPKNLLIAPLWSCHKKQVLNQIQHTFKIRQTWQGRCYGKKEE